jgi:hypothetical protein
MYHVGDNNDGVDEHVDPEVQPGAALTTAHVVVLISENRCQVNWNIITPALNMDRGGGGSPLVWIFAAAAGEHTARNGDLHTVSCTACMGANGGRDNLFPSLTN